MTKKPPDKKPSEVDKETFTISDKVYLHNKLEPIHTKLAKILNAVKPQGSKVTITRKQFAKVWDENPRVYWGPSDCDDFSSLCKALGFPEGQ